MRELKCEDPCELELGIDLELESEDVDAAAAAVAEASEGQIPCSCCNELLNTPEELHFHQIRQHTPTELSLALVNLRGLDLPVANGVLSKNGKPVVDDSGHLRSILLESGDRQNGWDSESTITVTSEARMAMISPPSSPVSFFSQELKPPTNVWGSWSMESHPGRQNMIPSTPNDSGFWSEKNESNINRLNTDPDKKKSNNKKCKDANRQFLCETCNRGYKKKSHLERHLRVHTGVRPYECHLCEKRFAVRSILNQHIRVHTGERPFSCNVCFQRFPQKSGLMTHMMLHNGKPFKCEHCVKSFVSNHKLMIHQRSHSDLLGGSPHLRPHHCCSSCEMRFFTTGALAEHMKLQHIEENHQTIYKADSTNEIVTISEEAALVAVSAIEDFSAELLNDDPLGIVKDEIMLDNDYDGSVDCSSLCETRWNDFENMCFESQFNLS